MTIAVLFSASWTQTPASWYRGGVDQSPIAEDAVDFHRRRPAIVMSISRILFWLHYTSTGAISLLVHSYFSCTVAYSNCSPYSLITKPPLLWLKFNLTLASKSLRHQQSPPLIGFIPWRQTPRLTSDARSIQFSHNIHASRKANM